MLLITLMKGRASKFIQRENDIIEVTILFVEKEEGEVIIARAV